MKKVMILATVAVLALIINSCMIIKRPLTTKAVFKVNYERQWISEDDVITVKYYLQRLDYLLQVEFVGNITEPIGNGDFFLQYTIIYEDYPRNYVKSTHYLFRYILKTSFVFGSPYSKSSSIQCSSSL